MHIGADVSRGRVISALKTATWVHFACHPKQRLAGPLGTGIYIAANDESSGAEILDLFTINRDIRIRKGTAVVLSACEGGPSTPHSCGETLSIASGFIAARAAFVVASLWKINDATAALTIRGCIHCWRIKQVSLNFERGGTVAAMIELKRGV